MVRLINKACRFPFALFIGAVFGIIAYVATIFAMLFFDWDTELESIKTVHNDIGNLFMSILTG